METNHRKHPKKTSDHSNVSFPEEAEPPPPILGRLPTPPHSSDHCALLFKGPDDDGDKKNHFKAGFLYEIEHKHLPPLITPVQLRSIRVAMVSEKTEMNVAVRFPSKESLKAFFICSEKETHPPLDEKFVMGIALANKVLVNLVTAQAFSEQKNLESFWLTEYLHNTNICEEEDEKDDDEIGEEEEEINGDDQEEEREVEEKIIKRGSNRELKSKRYIDLKKPRIENIEWPAERYKMAEENLMKFKEATAEKPIPRSQLGAEAKKHMAGKITPPPGLRPGDDSPTQESICARELNVFKDIKLEREVNELAASERRQELAISLGSSNCDLGSAYVQERYKEQLMAISDFVKEIEIEQTTAKKGEFMVQVEVPTPPSVNSSTPALAQSPHQLYAPPKSNVMPLEKPESLMTTTTVCVYITSDKIYAVADGRLSLPLGTVTCGNKQKILSIRGKFAVAYCGNVRWASVVVDRMRKKTKRGLSFKEVCDDAESYTNRWSAKEEEPFPCTIIAMGFNEHSKPVIDVVVVFREEFGEGVRSDRHMLNDIDSGHCFGCFGSGAAVAGYHFNRDGDIVRDDESSIFGDLISSVLQASIESIGTGGWLTQAVIHREKVDIVPIGHIIDLMADYFHLLNLDDDEMYQRAGLYVSTYNEDVVKLSSIGRDIIDKKMLGSRDDLGIRVYILCPDYGVDIRTLLEDGEVPQNIVVRFSAANLKNTARYFKIRGVGK